MAISHGGGSTGGNPGNFANDRDKAARAGHVGGTRQGKRNNPGNFANDRARAAEAGRKGGQSVAPESRSFSRNHQLAAEAGRKGGQQSHGRREDG